ncbi:hypothetical protein FRC05_002055 [Tulasnella sp. 425]|nr:hypothetical protein FRC05_002055 [Tulasnella sp. 425]
MQASAGSSNEEKRLIRKVDDIRRSVFRTQSKKEQEQAIQECAKLIPSRYLEVNRSAISLLVNVFKDHDDLQATIINKAYDMAEEAQLEVRYQAIDFIVDLSRKSPKWTSRNADVLIQLLAAESEDAGKIYQSITSHLAIEPAATLRTLCRFLDPADPDINTTPELRNKLYTYLIAQDFAHLSTPILQGFREGLIKAIPSSSFTELSVIIHDLLLPYLAPTDRGTPIVKALLRRALAFLKVEPFDSVVFMGITKGTRNVVIKLGSPLELRLELLSFFSEVLAHLVRFDSQAQMEFLKFLGENLDLPLDDLDPTSENLYLECRNKVAADLKGWAKVLLTCRDQLWETAVPLLQTVLDKRRDDPQWQPDTIPQDIKAVRTTPQTVASTMQLPSRATGVPAGVQPLKSYGPPPKRKAEEQLVRPNDPPSSTPSTMMGIRGAATSLPRNGDARPPIRTQTSRDVPPASLLQRLALDRTPSVSKVGTDSDGADGKDNERPSKRRRQDEGAASAPPVISRPGSLLSRIHNASSSSGPPTPKSTPQSPVMPTPAPVGGLKIGGIASVQNSSKFSPSEARSAQSAPPTPVPTASASTTEPPRSARREISLRGAAAAQGNGQRNRTVSASAAAESEIDLPPRPAGLSIKGASSALATGLPGKLGFQKALAGLVKPDSLPQRPRDVFPQAPTQAQPTPPIRPPVKKQQSGASLLSRFSDSPGPLHQAKSRGSLADRMDLG